MAEFTFEVCGTPGENWVPDDSGKLVERFDQLLLLIRQEDEQQVVAALAHREREERLARLKAKARTVRATPRHVPARACLATR